jgi:formylglycine-generating enzyme required for sulfatase activity
MAGSQVLHEARFVFVVMECFHVDLVNLIEEQREMKLSSLNRILCVAAIVFPAGIAQAVNIEMVTVGNAGNVGERSGSAISGGYGPGRTCGAVNYTYQIGKYEVTAGQYTEFLNAVGGIDTYGIYYPSMSNTQFVCGIARSGGGTAGNPYTYTVAPDFVRRPVNCVSWANAARFANWLHNGQPTGIQDYSTTEDGAYYLNGATTTEALQAVSRKTNWKWAITSEDEWYKAAYHKNDGVTGNYFEYPTSSDSAAGRDLADLSGNNANCYGTPYPISSNIYTTLVGEFQNTTSAYGTYDQCGNVNEWNEAIIGLARGLRGGSLYNTSLNIPKASFRNEYEDPASVSAYTGFRVVCVPEPNSLTMTILFASGGLVYWRRRNR